jgi:hypothetical protein
VSVNSLGPCLRDLCTADAVAYVASTHGTSGRLTAIIGPRAAQLVDALPESALAVVCTEHAHDALDELLSRAPSDQIPAAHPTHPNGARP